MFYFSNGQKDKTGRYLRHGAAPSLPDFYNEAVDGLEIGPNVGSCGTAAYYRRRVIVQDIDSDPAWQSFLPLAQKANLRACWSEPIISSKGKVLGTFALYSRQCRLPDEQDIERIEWASGYARLAIERKQAQTALAESERFNRATLDSLSANVAVLDAHGTIVATNRAWKTFAESNQACLQTVSEGANYLEVCDRAAAAGDADAGAVASALRQVIAGDQDAWFLEYPCHSPEEQRWFYCRVGRFPTDGQVHVVVSHENISEMKLAQEQLSVSRARYEALSRVSPVGIILFDERGQCVEVNFRWSEMTGIAQEQAKGQGWVESIHPQDRDQFMGLWNQLLRTGERFQSEHRLRPRNGQSLWVICQADPITNSAGQISGYVRILTDVTEHKVIEQTLRCLSTEIASSRGTEFNATILARLSELSGCETVGLFDRVLADSEDSVKGALLDRGKFLTTDTFPITNSPHAKVLNDGQCLISNRAYTAFPQDRFIAGNRIEAFAAKELKGISGQPLGHLAVMSCQPFSYPRRVEAVLELFALAVGAEMEREFAERRLSSLFENLPDAIVIIDSEGVILQANRQVQTIFGWRATDLLRQPLQVLIPERHRELHRVQQRQFFNEASPRLMGRDREILHGLRRDGSEVPVQISLIPMETFEGRLVAAAVRDISKQHRDQLAIEEANAFTTTVIENVSGLFYVLDQEGRYVRWNQTLQDLLGVSPEEMAGRSALLSIHPDDQEMIANKITEVFTSGQAETEGRLILTNGVRDYVLNGRRLNIGGRLFLAGSGIDITDRKQAEEQVRRLNQTLEQRVNERTEALILANEQLSKASHAKSEFLAVMSHELRTPLNGILGMNQLLLTTELNDSQKEFVRASQASGELLLQLINDILDLSKIEAGKLELDFRPCSIKKFMEGVIQIMVHPAKKKGLELRCHITPQAQIVGLLDDTRMRQVLVNHSWTCVQRRSDLGRHLAVVAKCSR